MKILNIVDRDFRDHDGIVAILALGTRNDVALDGNNTKNIILALRPLLTVMVHGQNL